MRAAQSLLSLDAGPRLALLRDAATCFIGALAVDADPAMEDDVKRLDAEAAWARLDEMTRGGALGARPAQLDAARAWIGSSRPLATADRGAAAEEALAASFAAVRWLARRIDPRSPAAARRAGQLRVAALVLGAGVVVGGVLAAVRWPRNEALGKNVLASSVPAGSRHPPAGLTNGRIELTFGAETEDEPSPWFVVDLGAPTPVDEVVVYDRGDGDPAANLPLVLELGDSLTSLETVATRTEPFTRHDPWRSRGLHHTARFVRVRKARKGALTLDEIEVYR